MTGPASGENRPRAIASAGEEDATVREYRDGDDLRRVHWRSTARRGELMVRREEQPWQSRCAMFLDADHLAPRPRPSSSLEWAVSAAASIGTDRIRRGYATTLLGGPTTLSAISHRTSAAVHQPLTPQQLLTECATVEEHSTPRSAPADRRPACAGSEPGDRDRRRSELGRHHARTAGGPVRRSVSRWYSTRPAGRSAPR